MTVTQPLAGGQADTTQTAQRALDQAVNHLLGLQHDQGWWQGELETNVTMDAEDLLLREFLRVRTPDQTAAAAQLAAAHRCLAETPMPDDVRAEFAGIAEFITARQW